MIVSFQNKETRTLYETGKSKKFTHIARVALRKLIQLDEALVIEDLAVPPGNRLESLRGNRAGQYFIRINDQYRICFVWDGKDADAVEICDYH
jgi:proteic killer suppression protein